VAARPRYYVDTSVYLAVLLGEEQGDALAAPLVRGQLLSSSLLILEATRNLIRLGRSGELAPADLQAALERVDQDISRFVLRDLTLDLCCGRTIPIVSTPRSLDLAHLRTALWFHDREPLTRFLSLDLHQTQAARELGLPVGTE